MEELPKSVRDAMSRQVPAGTHPEADLLTAFSEGSATAEERKSILAHLATCSECRDVLAFATPETLRQTVIELKHTAFRRWLWIPALAAVVVVAISASLLIRREGSGAEHAINITQSLAKPAAPSVPSDSQGEQPRTNAFTVPKNARPSTSKADMQPLATPERKTSNESVTLEKRKQEVASDAVVVTGERDRAKGNTESAQVVGGRVQPSPAVPLSRARPAMDAGVPRSQNETVAVAAENATVATEQSGSRNDAYAKAMRKEAQAPTASPAAPVRSAADMPASGAFAKNLSALAVRPQWRINGEGQIERSVGNGPWTRALGDLAGSTAFRVISVTGNDVWAGGNAGALFHSSDNGEHWSRVVISEKSAPLASAIIGVQFQDAQHGTLQTDAGETWTTSDGGAHWTRSH